MKHTAARSASAGCGSTPDIGDGAAKSYTTAAGREYKVHLPRDYDQDTPAPVIFSYHGAGGHVDQQAGQDRLTRADINSDHVVVYLQGNADDPDDPDRTTWQGAPENHSDDVAFTRDALDAVAAAYCIDPSRVYATGFSQGGGFIGAQLACSADLSARFAAYAPVSGAYYQRQVDKEADCAPATVDIACAAIAGAKGSSATPLMAFHGGSDDTIHYEGGFRGGACLPAIRHFVDVWVAADGLDDVPANQTIKGSSVAMRFGNSTGSGRNSGEADDDDGDKGLVTLVYAGDDVGHAWMSTELGTANFEASEWIMAFFRKHSL
ncbi:hypothetical protein SLS62_008439 [Diatrype stigma]|uniref:feruloyl esterase n=1 Tax=Diatrype stigma TaxID=117547 RepID=A0AAN9YLZ4_9PEZI